MKQRILSAALALCLCFSSQSVAYAWQEDISPQEDVLIENSTSGLVTHDSTIPTPTEVYEAMTALKDQDAYKEGTPWTDDEPYSDSKGYYRWKGGTLNGDNIVAVGCVAFAFILSDEAFGSLPNRMFAKGEFSYEDIRVGDILRVNNDTHTVIVLEVSDAGVVVAEGNNSGKVHWGRAISKVDVMSSTSHYITRYPEGYVPPDDPTANDIIATGTLDGGFTWNLTKAGTMTISGQGAMPDFSSVGDQPWSENSSQIRKVVIGNGVTSIGSCAFWNCGVLSAEISPSVTTIGNSAFRGSSIISVTIPSSVKTIGDSAFRECENLGSVTVSEGVETIVQNAFRACTSLDSIDFPSTIKKVDSGAFFQCTELLSATFAAGNNNKVEFGDDIFAGCYRLMSVILPQSIDRIGERMFQNCLMLPGVEIPQDAESIGTQAFASSGISVLIIPDSVTEIGIAAFSGTSLSEIYYTGTEAQWKSIYGTAAALSGMTVTMHYEYVPDNDDSSGSGDSSGNGSTIPPGDEGDGDNNDNNNGGNNDNNNGGNNDNNNGGNPGSGDNQEPEQTPLAKGKTFTINKVTYKVTKVGQEVTLTMSKSTATKVTINTVTGTDGVTYKVTSIGSKAMQNNKKMTSLAIGANVKTIGASAFSGCTKLTAVTFGKNVTSIGASAFKGCTALKKTLTLPDSVKTIGASAFSGCNKVTAVTIGKTSKSSLTTIGKSAFSGCKKLGKVTIKSTKLSSVGKQAFKSTKSSLKAKVPSKQLTKYKKLLKKAGLKVRQVTK